MEAFGSITKSYIFVPSKTGNEYVPYVNTLEAFTSLEMSPTVPMDVLQGSSSAVPSSITNTEISQGILLPSVKEIVVERGGNGVVRSTDYMSNNDSGKQGNPDSEELFLPLSTQYNIIDNGMGTIGSVDSEECYKADYANKFELTGNYRQMTNNYKRKYPDSCSGIPQEFIASFYGTKKT